MPFVLHAAANFIEGLGVFMITLALFRLPVRSHLRRIVLMNVWISAVNLLAIVFSPVPELSGLINLLLFILFMHLAIAVPMFWAVIICFTGYTFLGVVQFIGLSALQDVPFVLVQLLTAAVALLLARVLTSCKIGFTFSFHKFVFPHEKQIALLIVGGTIVFLVVASLMNDRFLQFLSVLMPLGYLFYLSVERELRQYRKPD